LVQNYICMLGVIPNQFFCRKMVNLVIYSCGFFIGYCMKLKVFTVVTFFLCLSGWSVHPKSVVINYDVDLSTDNVLVIVLRYIGVCSKVSLVYKVFYIDVIIEGMDV